MKKKLLVCLFATIAPLVGAFAQKTWKIVGTTRDIPQSTTIYFNRAVDGDLSAIDSVKLKNGHFEFKGTTAQPEVRYISFTLGKKVHWAEMFVEEGTINATLSPEGSTVRGTQNNDIYQDIKDEVATLNNGQRAIMRTLRDTTLTKDSVRALRLEYNRLGAEVFDVFRRGMKQNIKLPVGVMLFKQYSRKNTIEENQALLKEIPVEFQSDETVQAIARRTRNAIATAKGKPYVDLTMQAPDGKKASLSDFAGKGKYVLVDFWASWCGPCRKTMPALIEFYNKNKERGLDIVGVSFDSNAEAWQKAIKTLGIPWHHISDLKGWNSQAALTYNITAIPNTLLIDPEGRIVGKGLPLEDIEKMLK